MKKRTNDLQANMSVIKAVDWVDSGGRSALDIGCGTGRDSEYLVYKGFKVNAIDIDDRMSKRIPDTLLSNNNFDYKTVNVVDFKFGKYDLINAQHVLSFIEDGELPPVLKNIDKSLKTGGVLVGNIFGVDDEWNISKKEGMYFYTRDFVDELVDAYEIIEFSETKRLGLDRYKKPKFWHVFSFILQKAP